jgi:phosphate/phosphite/phosphonate ABC transporter binding protein
MTPRTAAALALSLLAGPALAGDPLVESMPLDPDAPITLGIGKPNGDKLARKAKADLEPYLSKALARPVKVEILPDYDALSTALADGKVDIAWTTPLAFVHAAQRRSDVTAIAKAMRAGKLFYRAAFIVRIDSTVRSLADLAGKRVAYVSRSSSSGYLFPRALLSSQGKDADRFFREVIFTGDHPGVCQAVRTGKVDAGATFSDEPPKGKQAQVDGCADSPPMIDFRIVAASGPIPNDVIAARPDFDERLVTPVLGAFGGMARTEEGRRVLKGVFHADAWGVAVEGDFKTVYEVMGVKSTSSVPALPAAVEESAAPAPKAKAKKNQPR